MSTNHSAVFHTRHYVTAVHCLHTVYVTLIEIRLLLSLVLLLLLLLYALRRWQKTVITN